jgi:16S rRNA (uracil1498-N3)-methyltransferase
VSLHDAGQAHAFVADLRAPVLDRDDRHHFERVLRLRPGTPVTVADGSGWWRVCRLGSDLEPVGDPAFEAAAEPSIGIGFALVKGDRPELVVQKLTELGVDVIVPFVAQRSVVRWDGERALRHGERLNRVAREAAMQCRRARLPVVEPVRGFADVVGRAGVALATLGGRPLDMTTDRLVLVGPEGGWSPDELASPPPVVGLAPHVLRSETAAIVAGALLAALRGRFIG